MNDGRGAELRGGPNVSGVDPAGSDGRIDPQQLGVLHELVRGGNGLRVAGKFRALRHANQDAGILPGGGDVGQHCNQSLALNAAEFLRRKAATKIFTLRRIGQVAKGLQIEWLKLICKRRLRSELNAALRRWPRE